MSKRKKAKRQIPRFESEDQERDFWARHEVVDYFDWDKAVKGSSPRSSQAPRRSPFAYRRPCWTN